MRRARRWVVKRGLTARVLFGAPQVYPVPQGGTIKLYKELVCPLDGFELVLFAVAGADGRAYPLCPYCYSHPPFEGATKVRAPHIVVSSPSSARPSPGLHAVTVGALGSPGVCGSGQRRYAVHQLHTPFMSTLAAAAWSLLVRRVRGRHAGVGPAERSQMVRPLAIEHAQCLSWRNQRNGVRSATQRLQAF